MTLVVARIVGESCFVLADTKLTPENGATPHPTKGAMKIAIVSPNLCVGFAGIDGWADDALAKVRALNDKSASAVVALLHAAHLESHGKTDFIAGFSEPTVQLWEIKNSNASEVTSSWIGEFKAFEAFQKCYLAEFPPAPNYPPDQARIHVQVFKCPDQQSVDTSVLERMKMAMHAVIDDPQLPSVGDFAAVASIDSGRWCYHQHIEIISHVIAPADSPPDGRWRTLELGTAAQGGYQAYFLSSNEASPPVCAVYFPQGKFGIVFMPENGGFSRAEVVESTGPLDFEERVARRYRIELKTNLATTREYADRAWSRLKRGDLPLALADVDQIARHEGADPFARWAVRYLRGCVHGEQNALDVAESELSAALSVEFNSPEYRADTFNARGIIYGEQGRWREAADDFAQALTLSPGHPAAANRERVLQAMRGIKGGS